MNHHTDRGSVTANLLERILPIAVVLSVIGICLLCTSISEGAAPINGVSFDDGDFDCIVIDDDTAAIIGYNGTESVLTIPSKVTYDNVSYTVTDIRENAFLDNTAIVDLTIPDTVIRIGTSAFKGCSSIVKLSIPIEINAVGSNTSPIFEGCNKIDVVTLTKGYVGEGAYYWLGIDTSENFIEYAPWYNSRTVIVDEGVRSIQQCTFYGCPNLVSLTLPSSLETIGAGAVACCPGLTHIDLPDELHSIGEMAFGENRNLTILDIPDGVEIIMNEAFVMCQSLRTVHLPDSLVSIGSTAFYGCSSLTGIVIPEKVTKMPSDIFNGCHSLRSVKFLGDIVTIGDGAFSSCAGLSSLDLPDTVTHIGIDAFSGCRGLTSLHLSDSLQDIGGGAFYGCTSLGSVTMGGNVVSVGDFAFYGCDRIGSVTLSASISSIGMSAFGNCIGLKEFILKDGGRFSVRDGVLFTDDGRTLVQYPCGKVGAYVIPDGVTKVAVGALEHLVGLTSVTVSASLASPDAMLFLDCPNLKEINVDKANSVFCSVDGIVYSKDMSTLIRCPEGRTATVIVAKGTEVIGPMAFLCSKVGSVVIGDMESLYVFEEAFLNCNPNLTFVSGKTGFDLEVCTDAGMTKTVTGKQLSDGWGGDMLHMKWVPLPDSVPNRSGGTDALTVSMLVAIVGTCLAMLFVVVRRR